MGMDLVKFVVVGLALASSSCAGDKPPSQQQQKLDYEGWQPINIRQSRDLSAVAGAGQGGNSYQVPATASQGSYYGASTGGQQTKSASIQVTSNSYQAPAPQNTYGSPRQQQAPSRAPSSSYSSPQVQQQPQIQLRSGTVQQAPRQQKTYRAPLIPAPVIPTSYNVPTPVSRPQQPTGSYSLPQQSSYSSSGAAAPQQTSYSVPTQQIPQQPQQTYFAPAQPQQPQQGYKAPQQQPQQVTFVPQQQPQTSYSAPVPQPQNTYSVPQQQQQQRQQQQQPQQQRYNAAPSILSAPAARPQPSYSAPQQQQQQQQQFRPIQVTSYNQQPAAAFPQQQQQQQQRPQQSYSVPQQQRVQVQQPQPSYAAPQQNAIDVTGKGPVPITEDIQSQFVSVDLPIAPVEAKKTLPSYPPHDPGQYYNNQQQVHQQSSNGHHQQQQQEFAPISPAENEVQTGGEQQVHSQQQQQGGYRGQSHSATGGGQQTEVVNQPATGPTTASGGGSSGEGSNEAIPGLQLRDGEEAATAAAAAAPGSGSGTASGSGPTSGRFPASGPAPAAPTQQGGAAGFQTSNGVGLQGGMLAIDQRIQSLPKDLPLLTLAKSVGGVETFLGLVQEAGLVDTLNGAGPFTIFVPTDEAFGILPSTLTSELTADKERLREVLLNHVVSDQRVFSADFGDSRENVATAAGGKTLRVNVYQLSPTTPKILTVNGARILKPDAEASNGVIHFINRVLYPFAEKSVVDIMFGCKTFDGIANLIVETDQIDRLSGPGPFTIFAPSNDAINRVKATIDDLVQNDKAKAAKVMSYHLVNGTYFSEGLFDRQYLVTEIEEKLPVSCAVTTDTFFKRLIGVNDARVTRPDIVATNGVIHLMDGVLDPESPLLTCNLL